MRSIGRCGRRRKQRKDDGGSGSLSHLPVFIALKKMMKNETESHPSSVLKKTGIDLIPAEFINTGRGLQCKMKISPGDVVMAIPVSLLITINTVMDSELGALILSSGQDFSPQQLLTIYLVCERDNKESFWLPYLNSLPTVYSTPIYYSQSELDLLPYRAREMALGGRERFHRACKAIVKFIRTHAPHISDKFDVLALKWAWCSINTRSVYLRTSPRPGVRLEPEESNVALAPFLDLLNHKDTSQVSAGFNEDNMMYEIISFDSYDRYSQVFINYGPHDNYKLLTEYGFTLPVNINNGYVFTIDTVCHHCMQTSQINKELLRRKKEILHKEGLEKHLMCTVNGVSWSLLTSVKILILSWDDLPKWKNVMQSGFISQSNSREAHEVIVQMMKAALRESSRHLHTVEKFPASTHKDLILSLARDDVKILEHSLSALLDET